jgi:hypothetical protein
MQFATNCSCKINALFLIESPAPGAKYHEFSHDTRAAGDWSGAPTDFVVPFSATRRILASPKR